jgi:sterol 3beta-glucosyltransferase
MPTTTPPPKKILLTAIGTRGDAQPLVIIAKRLMQDGHICRVAIHEKHRASVEKQGCLFFPVEGFDPDILMANQMGDRPGLNALGLRKMYQEWYKLVCASTWRAATEPFDDGSEFRAEVIISSHQQQSALSIAEKLGAALFFFNTYPMTPTVEFRHPFGTFLEGKDSRNTPLINRASQPLGSAFPRTLPDPRLSSLTLSSCAVRRRVHLLGV